MMKAGFAGDDHPRYFSSVVGLPKYTDAYFNVHQSRYIGPYAQDRRGILSIRHPIQNGVVCDWDDMEAIWHYTFYQELRIFPEEHAFLFTEAPLNPKSNREKMAEVMFETFSAPAIHIAIQGVLALYSNGCTTGLVLVSTAVSLLLSLGFWRRSDTSCANLGGLCITPYNSTSRFCWSWCH